ncbi:MAG: hypothetical protein O2924_01430 [Chloroflexi bacterium]|nr:hypothetical protein [Chloroflexota bacterium]
MTDIRPDDHWLTTSIGALLEQSGVAGDQRVHALASALVVEALRPYWGSAVTPAQAHNALQAADPELAEVLAALAPMLLGRIQAHEDAQVAIRTVESLLGIQG